MTNFIWGAATDTGVVRKGNEDSFLAINGLYPSLMGWAVTKPAKLHRTRH